MEVLFNIIPRSFEKTGEDGWRQDMEMRRKSDTD
jgi:hypothetical protein